MALHLVKLCVGVPSVTALERLVTARTKPKSERSKVTTHLTRAMPRRRGEILATSERGARTRRGSLFWVIGGVIACRQEIQDLRAETIEDRGRCCAIVMTPTVVRTRAQPRRPFQGWRYLREEDAPPDLADVAGAHEDNEIYAELMDLGLV